jgi:hypothetical protein
MKRLYRDITLLLLYEIPRDFQIKKYPVVLKAGEQGAGSRGRKGHFSCRNLDHLFCGILLREMTRSIIYTAKSNVFYESY